MGSNPITDNVIAVINSSEDTVELLRVCLQQHGFMSIITAHVRDIRESTSDFLEFIAEHRPAVVIYDVSIPYEANWQLLKSLMATDEMRGRPVVVTTTNKQALTELVGPTGAIEIVGKPYDIEAIVKSVERALGG